MTKDAAHLREVLVHCSRRHEAVTQAHPSWNPDSDARLVCFGSICALLRTVLAAMVAAETTVLDERWWEARFAPGSPQEYRALVLDTYGNLLRMDLITRPFEEVDGSFRLFLRALDAQACEGGRGAFYSVSTRLLSMLGLDHWREFLKFWSLARNTCHTKGVYLPRTSQSTHEVVQFDGKTYEFRDGELVRGMDWETAVRIPEVAIEMLAEVVQAPEIAALDVVYDLTAATWARERWGDTRS